MSVIASHFNESDTYVVNRANGRSDWLITYTIDGEGFFQVQGEKVISRTGDITILKPHTPHQYGTMPGQCWNFVWAHFTQQTIERYLLPEDRLYQTTIENPSSRQRIYRAFERIIGDSLQQNPYGQELCMNALREVLLLLLQRSAYKIDPRVEEVLHILSRRLHEPVHIGTLALSVGLSASRLSHLFKQYTGTSIIDTVNRMRVQQAALLMVHTDRTASEVCDEVGFLNYSHFSNQFRKVYSMSPSQFRNHTDTGFHV